MTEGSLLHNTSQCACANGSRWDARASRPLPCPGVCLLWTGVCGCDISNFVHIVVFHLPEATSLYPKIVLIRRLSFPPYGIKESSRASIDIPIDLYLKYS
ncbi:hypothetical protein PYW08_009831 [Mythimna loreyi]|uniref:Uncharacterized protein n=1 Tax=Mythimna loreyi TaxID=667449 RepID=A0ACC2QAY7_9NEOP|nr:hypothetical protein PYW08_009831 [Mythimna loreyi]